MLGCKDMATYRRVGYTPYRSIGMRHRIYNTAPRRKASLRMLRGHQHKPLYIHPILFRFFFIIGLVLLLLPSLSVATGRSFCLQA